MPHLIRERYPHARAELGRRRLRDHSWFQDHDIARPKTDPTTAGEYLAETERVAARLGMGRNDFHTVFDLGAAVELD